MQHSASDQLRPHGIDDRRNLHATHTDLLRERRAWQRKARPSVDAFLAISRQKIQVLCDQHLGQQARHRDPFVDDVRVDRCLYQPVTTAADPFSHVMLTVKKPSV